MKIDVRLYATLSDYLPNEKGQNPLKFEVRDGAQVRALLQELGIPPEPVKLVFINGRRATLDTILKDGDRLGVFPPIGGG